jgi:hypothetical protein
MSERNDNGVAPPPTVEELARWQKLADAATPGPWIKDAPSYAMPWMVGRALPHDDGPQREVICSLDVEYGNTDDAPRALALDYDQAVADAAFIASARDAVPRLIARVRELEANVDYLNGLVDAQCKMAVRRRY